MKIVVYLHALISVVLQQVKYQILRIYTLHGIQLNNTPHFLHQHQILIPLEDPSKNLITVPSSSTNEISFIKSSVFPYLNVSLEQTE